MNQNQLNQMSDSTNYWLSSSDIIFNKKEILQYYLDSKFSYPREHISDVVAITTKPLNTVG